MRLFVSNLSFQWPNYWSVNTEVVMTLES